MQLHLNSFYKRIGISLAIVFILTGICLSIPAAAQEGNQPAVDHSKFPALLGPFEKPQEVRMACLSCHTEAAKEIMHTTHWNSEFVNEATGQTLGKKTLINNFCVGIQSNELRCTSCHIGYGWADNTFDFSLQENIDAWFAMTRQANMQNSQPAPACPSQSPKSSLPPAA